MENVGFKIKELRRELNCSMAELTGNIISRQHINNLEKGKCCITYNVANKISSSFNEIAEKKGIDKRISIEYLINDKSKNANEALINLLESDSPIHEIEFFLEFNNNLLCRDIKDRAYTHIYNYYYNNHNWSIGDSYIRKIIIANFKNESFYKLASDYIKSLIFQNKNHLAVQVGENLISDAIENNIELDDNLKINIAVAYERIGEYKKCIDLIKDIHTMKSLNLQLLHCYKELKDIENLLQYKDIIENNINDYSENEKQIYYNTMLEHYKININYIFSIRYKKYRNCFLESLKKEYNVYNHYEFIKTEEYKIEYNTFINLIIELHNVKEFDMQEELINNTIKANIEFSEAFIISASQLFKEGIIKNKNALDFMIQLALQKKDFYFLQLHQNIIH